MEFNPPALANVAANQHLQDYTNFVCETLDEKTGKAAKRHKAALNMFTDNGNEAITAGELGQQTTSLVQQALLAAPGAAAAEVPGLDAPPWAVAMQVNMNNNMKNLQASINNNHADIQANINNFNANIQANINNVNANIQANINNVNARLQNGLVSEETDTLSVVTGNAGAAPPAFFPATYKAFIMLSAQRTTHLLNFYGLALPPTATARKEQLRRHLGIRTP